MTAIAFIGLFLVGSGVFAVYLLLETEESSAHPNVIGHAHVENGNQIVVSIDRTSGPVATDNLRVVVIADGREAVADGFRERRLGIDPVVLAGEDVINPTNGVEGAIVERESLRSGDEFVVTVSDRVVQDESSVTVLLVHRRNGSDAVLIRRHVTSIGK